MNKKPITLLIMAAGMGSRFGGLKQIEPVGPNKEFMIDYAIYDAIKVGFTKVVVIIKQENLDLFEKTIGNRLKKKIPLEYAFQDNQNVDLKYHIPEERKKPLGTAHAILCAKEHIHENFAVINADDFYGRGALQTVATFLKELDNVGKSPLQYGMVGYQIQNTLTDYGAVKRGLAKIHNGLLEELTESSVEQKDNQIIASPVSGNTSFPITEDTLCSMNLFGFSKEFMEALEREFQKFLEDNQDDLSSCEYLLPAVVENEIKNGNCQVQVKPTSEKWIGVTYKEDKPIVERTIKNYIQAGIYKEKLWED